MAGLNLLPWREKEREEKKKQFFGLLAGAGLLAGGLVLLGHFYMQSLLDYQQQRNDFLNKQIAELDKQIDKINQLDSTRQALLDRMQIIDDLQSTRPAIVHLFDEMVTAMPKGMYLMHLKQAGTKVQLEGKAESYARVSSYMNRLDASPWLNSSDLDIISTDKKAEEKETVVLKDFKLDVTQLLKQDTDDKASVPQQPQPVVVQQTGNTQDQPVSGQQTVAPQTQPVSGQQATTQAQPDGIQQTGKPQIQPVAPQPRAAQQQETAGSKPVKTQQPVPATGGKHEPSGA